jgi:hypothetical protein
MLSISAHVAQFLVDEEDWHGTLRDLRRSLVPGGVEDIFGGWSREPVGSGDGEPLVLARRPPDQ